MYILTTHMFMFALPVALNQPWRAPLLLLPTALLAQSIATPLLARLTSRAADYHRVLFVTRIREGEEVEFALLLAGIGIRFIGK